MTMGVRRAGVTACAALAAALLLAQGSAVGQVATQPALRAAFLLNFAKFAEWPDEAASAGPLTLCVIDDGEVQRVLADLVAGGPINGRQGAVATGGRPESIRSCHLVYLGEKSAGRAAAILDQARGAPVLTVSDGDEFIRLGGMVGFFVEGGRMRFAVNPDAAQRAGVRLSSKLLQLARIVRVDPHGAR